LLLAGLPNPGSAILHFGGIAPHADEGLIGEADGVMRGIGRGLIAMLKEADEVEQEPLSFLGQSGDVGLDVFKVKHMPTVV
jgi:hypothetical protein